MGLTVAFPLNFQPGSTINLAGHSGTVDGKAVPDSFVLPDEGYYELDVTFPSQTVRYPICVCDTTKLKLQLVDVKTDAETQSYINMVSRLPKTYGRKGSLPHYQSSNYVVRIATNRAISPEVRVKAKLGPNPTIGHILAKCPGVWSASQVLIPPGDNVLKLALVIEATSYTVQDPGSTQYQVGQTETVINPVPPLA